MCETILFNVYRDSETQSDTDSDDNEGGNVDNDTVTSSEAQESSAEMCGNLPVVRSGDLHG